MLTGTEYAVAAAGPCNGTSDSFLIRWSSGTLVRLHRPQAGCPFPLFQAIPLQHLQLRFVVVNVKYASSSPTLPFSESSAGSSFPRAERGGAWPSPRRAVRLTRLIHGGHVVVSSGECLWEIC